ncbi:hypothetical protein BGZ96_003193 [Linnemannia gamsii]|uniref:F-box domain-containing protein n=1 Tax=Linnemannia gamsii TaxID=64522 RepID=A0ABQ7JJL6_9FUNG|nr:hypothetical protein BGZ96_003193 [Linnemannia gamsii]
MYTHPLSLPEIVVVVGQFISLWESEHISNEIVWQFTPKSLLAAISVNRLFYTTLTPFLWTVYAEPTIKSIGSSSFAHIYCDTALDIVERNSPHIRVLDFSCYTLPYGRNIEQLLKLNYSRLQELRVSASVNSTLVSRLISANPGLHLIEWRRTLKACTLQELDDFKSLLQLQRLRYLSLEGWNPQTTYLYKVLHHNAKHLEELHVKNCNFVIPKPAVRDDKGKISITFAKSSEEAIEAFRAMRKSYGAVRLRKIKTLHVDVEQNRFWETLNWLFVEVPALETVVFGELTKDTAKALSEILRKYCPHLRTIKHSGICKDFTRLPTQIGSAAYLVGACAPGSLVHASLDGWRISSRLTQALLEHRHSLETLELTIRDPAYQDSFRNLGIILKRLSRLKHLTVYFYVTQCDSRQPSLFLDKLALCQGLVSLSFYGFVVVAEGDHSDGGDNNEIISESVCAEPVWRELRSGSDNFQHRCCDIFRRLVFNAICPLPSLKSVVLGGEKFEKCPPSLT